MPLANLIDPAPREKPTRSSGLREAGRWSGHEMTAHRRAVLAIVAAGARLRLEAPAAVFPRERSPFPSEYPQGTRSRRSTAKTIIAWTRAAPEGAPHHARGSRRRSNSFTSRCFASMPGASSTPCCPRGGVRVRRGGRGGAAAAGDSPSCWAWMLPTARTSSNWTNTMIFADDPDMSVSELDDSSPR